MELNEIESSNLKAIGYDEKTSTLGVEFKNGTSYFYLGVPLAVWKRFEEATSKGQFFTQSIKPHYEFFQLKPSVKAESLQPINETK